MLNFGPFIPAQATGYPDFLIHFACVSHCAGKVLAEAAKSETVCKSMRERGRVFRASASTTSMISSRYYSIYHLIHIIQIQFHNIS